MRKPRKQRVSKFKIGQVKNFALKGKIVASRLDKHGFVHLIQFKDVTIEVKESDIK
jgi:hypothetical protein